MNVKKQISNQNLFIYASAASYLIATLISGNYLTKLATYIGMSDTSIGLVLSFFSFCTFLQIITLFTPTSGSLKKKVVPLMSCYVICCTMLYVISLVRINAGIKSIAFVTLAVILAFSTSIASPLNTIWMYSFISDKQRGSFTAVNEICSLALVMVSTLILSATMDYFEAKGKIEYAFVIYCVVMSFFAITYIIALLKVKGEKVEAPYQPPLSFRLKKAFKAKNMWLILPIQVLFSIALAATTPFLATFQLNDLGFSLTLATVISCVATVLRMLLSKPIGKLGDKRSFISVVNVSFALTIIAFVFCAFSTQKTGLILFSLHVIVYSIAGAGFSGRQNLLFEFVPHTIRTEALIIFNVCYGIAGMLTSFAVTPLITHIQERENRFLWLESVYPQQVLAVISILALVIGMIYTNVIAKHLEKPHSDLITDDFQ